MPFGTGVAMTGCTWCALMHTWLIHEKERKFPSRPLTCNEKIIVIYGFIVVAGRRSLQAAFVDLCEAGHREESQNSRRKFSLIRAHQVICK